MSEETLFDQLKVSDLLDQIKSFDRAMLLAGGADLSKLEEIKEIVGAALIFAGHENLDSRNQVTAPQQVNFVEIDMRATPNKFNLRASETGWLNVHNWGEVNAELERQFTVSSPPPRFPNLNSDPFYDPTPTPTPTPPRKRPLTQLSMLPPTTDGAGTPVNRSLYVFKLWNPGNTSRNTNFRFSTRSAPFSLADQHFEAGGSNHETVNVVSLASLIAPDSVGGARRTTSSNWLLESFPGERTSGNEYPECTWACLLFDWNSVGGSKEDFAIRFNIHVEVRDGKKDESWIPIIIDPDIGHPGGNNTGP